MDRSEPELAIETRNGEWGSQNIDPVRNAFPRDRNRGIHFPSKLQGIKNARLHGYSFRLFRLILKTIVIDNA